MESKDEKLAQARKKLLNYQKRQQKSRTEVSSPVSNMSNMDLSSSRTDSSQQPPSSFNHDEKLSPFEWLHQPSQERDTSKCTEIQDSGHSVAPKIVTTAKNDTITCAGDNEVSPEMHQESLASGTDFNAVNSALEEALSEKEKLSAQLVELHQHYSEIYAAYNTLINTVQSGCAADSEVQTQLSQLRTAMSVIVEEKTTLQQQLREANEVSKKQYNDIKLLNKDIHDKSLCIGKLERELNELKAEHDRSTTFLQRQKEELENNRRELTSLKANILHVQQDRNDAQERLKLSLKSIEKLQSELDEIRKQLRVKDLYIRQLGAYSTSAAVNEQDIKSLQAENERLNAELLKAQDDIDHYRREALAAREHYEVYGGQLNQKVLTLSNQVAELNREKVMLQDKLAIAEEEVREHECRLEVEDTAVLQDVETMGSKDTALIEKDMDDDRFKRLNDELNSLKDKLINTENSLSERTQRCSLLEDNLANKDAELDALKKDLIRLESQLDEHHRASQDFCRLSSELQNEKATLSRAIAQNRELKDQLAELQDKMISLSTENMECESERLTALHTIEQLKTELMTLKGLNSATSISSTDNVELTNVSINNSKTPGKLVDDKDEHDDNIELEECLTSIDKTLAACDINQHSKLQDESIVQLNSELETLRNENRRISRENDELRRIMEQNAEDENQNNIHVELGQAMERISTLSTENEELHNLNEQLQKAVSNGLLETSAGKNNLLHTVAVNTEEHADNQNLQGSSSSLLEKPFAWTELEARFAKVMRQNAELIEQNELLEHVILQLQSENDTIGEYVTIYQHQRKIIQDRVRAKEEAVARLSLEKEQVKQKLNDLEAAVSRLFSSKGTFNGCTQKLNGTTIVADFANLHCNKAVTGSEIQNFETLKQLEPSSIIPRRSTNSSPNPAAHSEKNAHLIDAIGTEQCNSNGGSKEILEEEIIRLINELQDIEQVRSHAQCCAVNICCKECRGKLITL